MDYKDYYQTLGVARSADEKEIKKAFRKLAQQYHPDKNPGDQVAEQKFKEINEAYTVLSDADKRAKYDRFGSQWEQYGRANGGPGGPGGAGTRQVTPEELDEILRQMGLGGRGGMGGGMGSSRGGGGFSSFFDTLFGGGAAGGASPYGAPGGYREAYGGDPFRDARPATVREVPVKITLEEAFAGTSRMLESADGGRFEVTIPRGVKTGSKVRMRGAAGQGDIILKIDVHHHDRFHRDGDNLRVVVPVDLLTAVLGGEVQVPTLERAVVLTIPPGTQGGKVFRLRGLGMPQLKNPSQRGDLLADVQIKVPTTLTDQEKQLFEELRSLQG